MKIASAAMTAILLVSVVQAGCVRDTPEPTQPGVDVSISGWYAVQAGQATFHPCGKHERLSVVPSALLSEEARAFVLIEGNPVYARVKGVVSSGALSVSEVEQFGSPEPVTDCAIAGMVFRDDE